MNYLRQKFETSPAYARVAPFIIFLILTTGQDMLGADFRYWLYLAKTLVGMWLIWEMRRVVTELRWAFSWEAAVVGVGIFVLWVGLDPLVPKNRVFFKPREGAWNPNEQFGAGSALAWTFVLVRI